MSTRRAHVVIPEELVRDIEQLVGRRQGSAFLTQAAEEKLMRFRQLKAVESSAANWKDEDHPELKGAARYISKLRQQNDRRYRKVTAG